MTYYLYMNQKGYGCDYTIGCGEKMIALEGDTLEEAMEFAVKEYLTGDNYSYGWGDYALCAAYIVEIREDLMPTIERLHKEAEEAVEVEKKRRKEYQEKDELARLKKKYE